MYCMFEKLKFRGNFWERCVQRLTKGKRNEREEEKMKNKALKEEKGEEVEKTARHENKITLFLGAYQDRNEFLLLYGHQDV